MSLGCNFYGVLLFYNDKKENNYWLYSFFYVTGINLSHECGYAGGRAKIMLEKTVPA